MNPLIKVAAGVRRLIVPAIGVETWRASVYADGKKAGRDEIASQLGE